MSEPTVGQRLPKNLTVHSTHSKGKVRISVSLTMETADEARAMIVALQQVIVPMFDLLDERGETKETEQVVQ